MLEYIACLDRVAVKKSISRRGEDKLLRLNDSKRCPEPNYLSLLGGIIDLSFFSGILNQVPKNFRKTYVYLFFEIR